MKFKPLYTLALAALMATGCKKEFLDVNTNPNLLPTATPAFVLTNAMNVTTTTQINANETGSYFAGQWTQSSSYILNTNTFAYQYSNVDFNYWDGIYDNLQDYEYVIKNSDALNQKFFKGPAKVMKAFNYQTLVDLYGNIPYSDALKGIGSLAPKFDDAKAVYEDLIKLLDEAIVDLKANAFTSAFTSSDIIFRGNTTKWVRFANSLKLRILMHQSRVAGRTAYITAEINKIVAEGSGFITGEEVGVGGPSFYVATAGKTNPMYDRWAYDANGALRALARFPRPTKYLFDVLKASNDTFRLKRIAYARGGEGATPGVSAQSENVSNYIGVPFGIGSGFTAPASSYIGPSLFVKGVFNKAFILMTASEIQFMLAEAKERYGASVNLTGTTKSYYDEGVRQSFRTLGVANAEAQATVLLNSGIADADFTASTDKLRAITIQKWLALTNFSGLEAWTEYRKTGLPNTPQASTVTDNNRPVRLFYPATELGSNGANVPVQSTTDKFTNRIFWDVD